MLGSNQRKVRWMRQVAHMGEMTDAYKILIRKPEGKRPLERSRYRWEIMSEWFLRK
jgi:hypothetical protein